MVPRSLGRIKKLLLKYLAEEWKHKKQNTAGGEGEDGAADECQPSVPPFASKEMKDNCR